MKNALKLSLFTLSIIYASQGMAATGTGHAQVELLNPLTVSNQTTLDFGKIAIDPAAGATTLSMTAAGVVTCPASYVCSGSTTKGEILITGAPGGTVNVSVSGSTALLSDGSGHTLTFDPVLTGGVESLASVNLHGTTGQVVVPVGGSIGFAGTEVAGVYTSTAGTPYTVTVNY